MITVEQEADENNVLDASRWSVPELKERQSNISVFARISEEYNDAEHCCEFLRKTGAILFQTKAASCLFALSLVLPVVMIGVGPSFRSSLFVLPARIRSFRHFQFGRMSVESKHSRLRSRWWSDRSAEIATNSLETVQSSSRSRRRGDERLAQRIGESRLLERSNEIVSSV